MNKRSFIIKVLKVYLIDDSPIINSDSETPKTFLREITKHMTKYLDYSGSKNCEKYKNSINALHEKKLNTT